MNKKNAILVTGGAGYIGSHACKALSHIGYFPIVYDNLAHANSDAVKWGPLVKADLLDQKKIEETLETYRPIAVMHFAASALVIESVEDPARYYRNNVQGTLNLLDACRCKKIQNFIFSSSCASYGVPIETPITENTRQNPVNPYGRTKLIAEKMLEDFQKAYGMNYISLRYFNAVGADFSGEIGENHDPETHLIPLLIRSALHGTPFTVFGNDFPTDDGYAVRDFIHVVDLARAHILSLDYLLKKKKSHCINIGTGKGFSVCEIIASLEKILDKKIPIQIGPRRNGEPPILVASIEKAKRILGFCPKYSSLDTILQSALHWHSKQHLIGSF